jgi:hypothetical protein
MDYESKHDMRSPRAAAGGQEEIGRNEGKKAVIGSLG